MIDLQFMNIFRVIDITETTNNSSQNEVNMVTRKRKKSDNDEDMNNKGRKRRKLDIDNHSHFAFSLNESESESEEESMDNLSDYDGDERPMCIAGNKFRDNHRNSNIPIQIKTNKEDAEWIEKKRLFDVCYLYIFISILNVLLICLYISKLSIDCSQEKM